jgi:hypothetical protein
LKTGELLAREGYVRQADIDMALSIQESRRNSLSLKKSRLFGMILCDLNLVTPVDNYWVLHKYHKIQSVQSALIADRSVSKEEISAAEKMSKEQQIPFISLLLKQKKVSLNRMQQLLFDLFHVPFRSISDFIFKEKDRSQLLTVMDGKTALENKILPLVVKSNTLLFGITDPDNILVIKKLSDKFPQYRFKILFIPYSGFSWFYDIIYQTRAPIHAPVNRPLDLSSLLNFKTEIQDPEQETAAVQELYEQYELLRMQAGNPPRTPLENEFLSFVIHSHQQISQAHPCQSIEFSLKKKDGRVNLLAFPKN